MQIKEPQTQNVVNIFVDLDETLIHTDFTNEDLPNEIPSVNVKLGYGLYKVFKRPGANELLFALRGVGNVFMLTRATRDYAIAMNELFNFAFPSNRIYSRKVVENYRYEDLDLPGGTNFLIDDLPQIDNYEKVVLIAQLGPVHYIHIKPFYGYKDEALTKSDVESIVNLIQSK